MNNEIIVETVSFPHKNEVWRITRTYYRGAWSHNGYPSRKKDGKRNLWSHAIGHNGCGYANWAVTRHEGINPAHKTVDRYFKSYAASLGRGE